MVNEINVPKEISENAHLEQRLVASSQALHTMQLEHEQLLQEMEQLRQRAEDLRQLKLVVQTNQELQQQQQQQDGAQSENLEKNQEQPPCSQQVHNNTDINKNKVKNEEEEHVKNTEKEETAEDANYIQAKLAEIARLKAQFKKVQNLINTTTQIEEHLKKTSTTTITTTEMEDIKVNKIINTHDEVKTIGNQITSTSSLSSLNKSDIDEGNSNSVHVDEKRQLLNAMVDMFQDLSGDLRDQVSNLQAERERIKALKEDISAQRQQRK